MTSQLQLLPSANEESISYLCNLYPIDRQQYIINAHHRCTRAQWLCCNRMPQKDSSFLDNQYQMLHKWYSPVSC